jgi:hypothetical protein
LGADGLFLFWTPSHKDKQQTNKSQQLNQDDEGVTKPEKLRVNQFSDTKKWKSKINSQDQNKLENDAKTVETINFQ